MGPWVPGLIGTYSTFTVWGDCRVLKVDGRFTVARTLYYPYYELRVPMSMGNLVHTAT